MGEEGGRREGVEVISCERRMHGSRRLALLAHSLAHSLVRLFHFLLRFIWTEDAMRTRGATIDVSVVLRHRRQPTALLISLRHRIPSHPMTVLTLSQLHASVYQCLGGRAAGGLRASGVCLSCSVDHTFPGETRLDSSRGTSTGTHREIQEERLRD